MQTQTIKDTTWEKQTIWQDLIQGTAMAACLTAEEINRLDHSLAAEIIAAVCFISGCRNPLRIAVTHCMTLIASIRCREVYKHFDGQSLRMRLEPIFHFPGGNRQVIRAGMLLLEILSLNDHKRDLLDDMVQGKENPLILELNHQAEWDRLMQEWKKLPLSILSLFSGLYDRCLNAKFWV